MDVNDVPYSKSPSIPLKLRQLFKEAGVPSTPDGRISWAHVPYALYKKGVYLAGLSATVFFATDKPTEEEKAKRVREHLKWPPSGANDSMKSLTSAFSKGDNSVRLVPRPVGRDVVFELVSQDGTTFDLGQWKIPASVIPSGRKPMGLPLPTTSASSFRPNPLPNSSLPTVASLPPRPATSFGPPASLPAKPWTPAAQQNKPSSSSVRQTEAPVIEEAPTRPPAPEPYPKTTNIPLQFKKLLDASGAPESKMHPGKIGWSLLPDWLYKKGLYIKGLPSLFVLEAKNPTLDSIERKMSAPFYPSTTELGLKALRTAVERNEVSILRRGKNRDVVFEVVTGSGSHDLGKWKDKEDKVQKENQASTSKVPKVTADASNRTKPPIPPKQQQPPAVPKPAPSIPKPPQTVSKPVVSSTTKSAINGGSWSKPATAVPIPPVRTLPPTKSLPASKPSTSKTKRIVESSTSEYEEEEEEEEESSDDDEPMSAVVAKPVGIDFIDPLSNPFPRSRNVPLNLRRLLDRAGVKEDSSKPDIIPWETVPYVLWKNEFYIKGLPILFVLGKNTIEDVVQKPWQPLEILRNNPTINKALIDGLDSKTIQLLHRETARNVVFEVVDNHGQSISIGRWEAPEPFMIGEEEADESEQSDSESDAPPQRKWLEEKNEVLDEFARMLVDAGVNLPPHPTRKNAYQIQWSSLPRLLHAARCTVAGFPLTLLPYWHEFSKLNGRWAITWKRDSLDDFKELLDCDAIDIEKWPEGVTSGTVIQAFDPNRTAYAFTLDDFVNAERDDPEQLVRDGVSLPPLDRTVFNLRKRKAASDTESDRPIKRYKTRHTRTQSGSAVEMRDAEESEHMDVDDESSAKEEEDESMVELPRRNLMADVPLDPDMYWKQPWWTDNLTVAQKIKKSRWQKEILKNLIAILLYHDIPCVAPDYERLSYFLPWSNLPRHLAARDAYLMGWPQDLAPVVDQDVVVAGMSGPASWGDREWKLLEDALDKDQILIEKRSSNSGRKQALFELVSPEGKKELSAVNFTKRWLGHNIGVEAGQPIGIMADEVLPYDPILNDTEDEYESEVSMDD